MPDRPPTICREPGCGKIAHASPYCDAHIKDNRSLRAARDRNAIRRESGLKSLYDSALWRVRTRRLILGRDPLCMIAVLCGGRALSTDVDHIIRAEVYIARHGGDESYFWDPDNLRGACHTCHAHKTAAENHGLWDESKVEKALAAVL